MLALLLAIAMQSAPVTPVISSLPGLHMDAPDWAFDTTAPVESEERADLDVYETEEP